MSQLVLSDHAVTPEERADVMAFLAALDDTLDAARALPADRHACQCPRCDCTQTSLGLPVCRACEAGDCLYPEASR